MAIGSPFGLENTVTAGIVSAKQRDTGDYLPFIQTDVAINPGNSGGPLINMRGEVVGINSQIYSRSGGFMGISFAIPIDEAIRVSRAAAHQGRVSRGRIGVQIDQVTKDVAESIGLGKAQGALVRSVEAGSPADKAGVEAGDIITKFNGKAIEKARPAAPGGQHQAGHQEHLTVFRRGASRDLSVTIAEIEPDKPARAQGAEPAGPKPKASAAAKSLGLAGERAHRRAEEGAQDQGRREGRRRHRPARARRSARGRHHRGHRQCRGGERPEFESAVGKADKSKALSVLFRRGDWAQYALIRPAR
jgi:serine protease Do